MDKLKDHPEEIKEYYSENSSSSSKSNRSEENMERERVSSDMNQTNADITAKKANDVQHEKKKGKDYVNGAYNGKSFMEANLEMNDQQRRNEMTQQGNSNGLTAVDEQFNKKQIEFKGGKVH